MKKLKLTLLTFKQVFGRGYSGKKWMNYYNDFIRGRLSILNKVGVRAQSTDYAKLLGSYDTWWIQDTNDKYKTVDHCVPGYGGGKELSIGIRPSLPYKSIASLAKNKVMVDGVLEVEYGEYPQSLVSDDLAVELENAFVNKTIKTTGKLYSHYGTRYKNSYQYFLDVSYCDEYEYNGKKYIRYVDNSDNKFSHLTGENEKKGKVYWIAVEPIKWLVDEKANIAISKKIICAGVPFDIYGQKFKNSIIKEFLDKYLSIEIVPSRTSEKIITNEQPGVASVGIKKEKNNKYGFKFQGVGLSAVVDEKRNNTSKRRR